MILPSIMTALPLAIVTRYRKLNFLEKQKLRNMLAKLRLTCPFTMELGSEVNHILSYFCNFYRQPSIICHEKGDSYEGNGWL